VELKKENWLFNKRFETWFKKVEGSGGFQSSSQPPEVSSSKVF